MNGVPDRLVLWEPDLVIDWVQRNATYARLRDRANAGIASINALVYAEVLRIMRLRPSTLARLNDTTEEIREQFVILELTVARAQSYAEAVPLCRKVDDPDVKDEPWFAFQVALCRSEGHRIMTKAPQWYTGLVARDQLG